MRVAVMCVAGLKAVQIRLNGVINSNGTHRLLNVVSRIYDYRQLPLESIPYPGESALQGRRPVS